MLDNQVAAYESQQSDNTLQPVQHRDMYGYWLLKNIVKSLSIGTTAAIIIFIHHNIVETRKTLKRTK